MPPTPPARRRLRRIALRAALGLASMFLLYAVAANLLLANDRLGRLLSAKPAAFRLEYERAYSLWFGRVHVDGLTLRVRDAKMECQLRVDHADASISLLSLLGRHFRTTRVDATGVSWRTRFRHEDGVESAERVALLPTIDGFPDAPVVDGPPLPASDADAHAPFTLDLEGLTLHAIREVWIDAYRLAGDLDATGGFVVAPRDRLEVLPAHVDVRDATLAAGPDAIVTGVHGAIDARIDSTPLKDMTGAELARRISTRASLDGTAGGISFLRHFLLVPLEPSGGGGAFHGTLVVDHGISTRESVLHADLERASVVVDGGYELGAAAVVDVTTAEDDGGHTGTAHVALRDVSVLRRPGTAPMATSSTIALTTHIDPADFAAMPRDFTYAWDAPVTSVADLRVLNAALGHTRVFVVDGGTATVATSGHGSLRAVDAHVKVDSTVAATLEGAHLTSRVAADVPITVVFDARTIDLSGATVDLAALAVRGGASHPGWTGHVKLDSAVVRASPPALDLHFTARARDARPALALYAAMDDVSPATRVALALVPDPAIEAATADLAGTGRLRVGPETVSLQGLDVRGSSARARGEWTKHGRGSSGGFLFEAGPLSAGLAFEGEGARAVLLDAPGWFAQLRGGAAAP